ncbi:Hypothetical protein NTJ_09783 [Nesidiocoris tenuis]|uniref:Uncharacterized protein n=1 Tax=Nesidiocoris tenuis TaxID=355587 RepID=A0ABN7AXQ7_9HEMI|nr:Hypothetical protein NTJ_09783 [Nesidiocoris tenuis]
MRSELRNCEYSSFFEDGLNSCGTAHAIIGLLLRIDRKNVTVHSGTSGSRVFSPSSAHVYLIAFISNDRVDVTAMNISRNMSKLQRSLSADISP